MKLTEYDITNIAILSNMIKNLCSKLDKDNEKIGQIDSCARKILSIIKKNESQNIKRSNSFLE